MNKLGLLGLLLTAMTVQAQRFPRHELSVNAFRNPSIGLEYRMSRISVHAGYYPTIVSQDGTGQNVMTSFFRTGLTYWFAPVGHQPNLSSFYTSLSYVRGLNRDYEAQNGGMGEVGFRWFIWKGLNLRIGAALLASPSKSLKLNPTPGISYSFTF